MPTRARPNIRIVDLLTYISRRDYLLMLADRRSSGNLADSYNLWMRARELHLLRQVLVGDDMPSHHVWSGIRDQLDPRGDITRGILRMLSKLPEGVYPASHALFLSGQLLATYLEMREFD